MLKKTPLIRKTPLKKSGKGLRKQYSPKNKPNTNQEKTDETFILHKWFISLFDRQKDKKGYCYCVETGTAMHENTYKFNSCVYSHYFAKSIYPQFAMKEWNIAIVLPDVHTQYETTIEHLTPKLHNIKKQLKNQYL